METVEFISGGLRYSIQYSEKLKLEKLFAEKESCVDPKRLSEIEIELRGIKISVVHPHNNMKIIYEYRNPKN